MVYFVFDLDSTLADISPIYFYLELLVRLSSVSVHMARTAYKHFLQEILEREANPRNPLYILRPRILDKFIDIKGLIQMKRCEGVAIYSNNGYLPCLEFVRDLIHEFLETNDIICTCIYLRDRDRRDGSKKTWRDLKDILVDRCGADPSLGPESVVFFDDLPDHDLRKQLPPENYIHVEAYNYTRTDESLVYIKSAFIEAIQACGIIDQPVLYSNYVKMIRSLYKISGNTNNKSNTMQTVLGIIDADARKTPERTGKPVLDDANIMEVINRYYNDYVVPPLTPLLHPLVNPNLVELNGSPKSPVSPGFFIANTSAGLNNSTPLANPFQTSHLGGKRIYRKKRNTKTLRKGKYKQKTRTYTRRV